MIFAGRKHGRRGRVGNDGGGVRLRPHQGNGGDDVSDAHR